jgi:hypothetical protein
MVPLLYESILFQYLQYEKLRPECQNIYSETASFINGLGSKKIHSGFGNQGWSSTEIDRI